MSHASSWHDLGLGRELREEPVSGGLSGAHTSRVIAGDGRVVAYVKVSDHRNGHLVEELAQEAARLVWLRGRGVRVPEVLSVESEHDGYLLTRALSGVAASEPIPQADRNSAVTSMAVSLRELHRIDVSGCPFDRSLGSLVRQARVRTAAGLVERSWQLAGKHDITAPQALLRLEQLADHIVSEEAVMNHGDFTLPNVLLSEADGVGFVDVGRAGAGDRHSDVADMMRSLRSQMNPQYGEDYAQLFLDAYGRDLIDEQRLALYDLVEEFFWPALDPATRRPL